MLHRKAMVSFGGSTTRTCSLEVRVCLWTVSDAEFTLFDLDVPEPALPVEEEKAISAEQVQRLQAAFNDAGLVSVEGQKELVRMCVVRPIASLYDLRPSDLRPIFNRISERAWTKPRSTGGSSWDNRDEETWIDKL